MIHADFLRYAGAFEFYAKEFDSDSDFNNWGDLKTAILSIAFLSRSFIVAAESPTKRSWVVSDHIQRDKQPFIKKAIDGRTLIITKVDSASRELLNEIGTEEPFRLASLWLLIDDDIDTSVVNEIYDLRKAYPTQSEKWYSCKTEFMLCEADGRCIVWNCPNLEGEDFMTKIQIFCAKMDIGISITTVDL